MQNAKEVITLVAALCVAVDGATADGKVGMEDLGHLMGVLPAVGPAAEGVGEVAAELAALDEATEAELHAHIEEKFGAGKYELLGEDLLLAAVHFARVLQHVKGQAA